MFPPDEKLLTDSGYGEVLKRKDGSLYHTGYRGTDDVAGIRSYIIGPVREKK